MKINSAGIPLILIISAFLITGCDELDLKNPNQPDFETTYSTPENIKALTGSLIQSWFITTHNYSGWARLYITPFRDHSLK